MTPSICFQIHHLSTELFKTFRLHSVLQRLQFPAPSLSAPIVSSFRCHCKQLKRAQEGAMQMIRCLKYMTYEEICISCSVWEKAEGWQDAIYVGLVKKDCCSQLSTSTVETTRCNSLQFQQGARRKIGTDCLGGLWRCHHWRCLRKDQKFVRSKAGVFDSVPRGCAKRSRHVSSTLLLHDSKTNTC